MSFQPASARQALVVVTNAAQLIELPGWTMLVKVVAPDTSGSLTVIRGTMDADHIGATEHVHAGHDETFFVLDGTLRFRLGHTYRDVTAGETAYAPRHLAHGFSNRTPAPSTYLAILTPSGYETYFEKVAQHFHVTGDMPNASLTERLMNEHQTTLAERGPRS